MIYVNNVDEGGETVFPSVSLSVRPPSGMAVVWHSLRPDGSVNTDRLYWAKPVFTAADFK